MTPLACPSVPVSWGELLDKLTILEIKRDKIARVKARANVEKEYLLISHMAAQVLQFEEIATLMHRLKQVNVALWDIEDAIRRHETDAQFGASFVDLARSVYKTNDARAELKHDINTLLQSELMEEKSYAGTA